MNFGNKIMNKRFVVIDSETTGFTYTDGGRIIELGCVEIINNEITGNTYQQYINPNFPVEPQATEVNGLTNEFLSTFPVFENIVQDFVNFVGDSKIIMHHAPFDIGFIENEFKLLNISPIDFELPNRIYDTRYAAKQKFPNISRRLNNLCDLYGIDRSERSIHGAILDATLTAQLFLKMTSEWNWYLKNAEY